MDTQTKENIVKEYQNGAKLTDIFHKYHTGYKTVSKILDAAGIDHSRSTRKKGIPNPKNERILTLEEEQRICQIYQETRRMSDCQEQTGISQPVVIRCLKKYGLHRTHNEIMKTLPQNQRKYPVKDNYFDTESSNMAYILGFLAADGSVGKDTNNIKVGLSSIDREILEKFYNEIGGRPIKDYITQSGFPTSNWVFTSQHIKEKLSEYNIVPDKTFTFTFPLKLDKQYWKDFIRGYFDGDGSISSAGPSAIRFQICATNKDVLEKILDFFEEQGIERPCIYSTIKEKKHLLYYFQYSSAPTRKIYDILYYDGCLCLARKKKKYEELINNSKK